MHTVKHLFLLSKVGVPSPSMVNRKLHSHYMSVRSYLVQTPAATLSLIDVEIVHPNSFKKMHTDHEMPHNGNVY